MKTYKEQSFYIGIIGNIYNSGLSKIFKTSSNKIRINAGRVAVYRPINTEVEFGDGEVTETSAGTTFGEEILSQGPFYCPYYSIPSMEDVEITENTSVYVKIAFSAESGPGSYVDFGFSDGSPIPFTGESTPDAYFNYGMLSRKTYTIQEANLSYELGLNLEDSDEETPNGEGYTGHFYIKIADIEKTETSLRIKQYHTGVLDITPPVILYDAYSITV